MGSKSRQREMGVAVPGKTRGVAVRKEAISGKLHCEGGTGRGGGEGNDTTRTYDSEVGGEGEGWVGLEVHPAAVGSLVLRLHLLEREGGGGGVEGDAGAEQ